MTASHRPVSPDVKISALAVEASHSVSAPASPAYLVAGHGSFPGVPEQGNANPSGSVGSEVGSY